MSKNCHCDHTESRRSSFVFGLILGAIIGAVIAIIIYKKNKSKVIESLKTKLEDFFKNLINLPKTEISAVNTVVKHKKKIKTKKPVSEKPITISKPTSTPIKKRPAPKMFVKPRR